MLSAIVNGYAALWRVDTLGFGAEGRAAGAKGGCPASASVAAAVAVAAPASASRKEDLAKKKAPAGLSINDRLRTLMGPIITEEQLQEKVRQIRSRSVRTVTRRDGLIVLLALLCSSCSVGCWAAARRPRCSRQWTRPRARKSR
jgi:hypothetical protein